MNTYLIVGETIYQIEKKLQELKKNIQNVITFNMEENSMDEILEESSYFSMFDDEKCVIVKNAKIFGASKNADTKKNKEDSDKLLKYLDSENKNTKLIFIYHGKPDSKKKIYNILKGANNVFEFKSLTKTEIKNELNNLVNEQGYKIEDKSLWYIINNSLNNLDLAVNEIKKIMLYYGKPTNISYNDVLKLTSKTMTDNNFKLVDSIIAKDLDNSLKYLEEIKTFKVEPSVILALLYREFKLMLSATLLKEKKYQEYEIMKNLKLADWQLQKVLNNLRNYSKEELKMQIIKLGDLDYLYKSGEVNKDVILVNYIMDLCTF